MTQLFFALVTFLAIFTLVFVHEAGHYIAARLAGVRVLVFSFGFGPRLWGFVRGGCDYRISAVPLGGYVRVAGDDPTQRDLLADDDLHAKGVPARALFYAGGALMNLVFAFVAFPFVFRAGVEFTAPVLGAVQPGSPAWEGGLQPGDRVKAVDGKAMYSFENMSVEVALAGDRDVELLIERDGDSFTRTVHPRWDENGGRFHLGIDQPIAKTTLVVDDGSPAHDNGLRTGDELVSFRGAPVDAETLLVFARTTYTPQPTDVVVQRGGEPLEVTFTPELTDLPAPLIGVMPAQRRVIGVRGGTAVAQRLGLLHGDHILDIDGKHFTGGTLMLDAPGETTLRMRVLRDGTERRLSAPITAEERQGLGDQIRLGYDTARCAIAPQVGSPAEQAGLSPGDVVLAIDGQAIASWEELKEAVGRAGAQPMRVVARTATGERELTLQPAIRGVELGFGLEAHALRERYRVDSFGGAIKAGMVTSVDMIKQLYVTLKKLFTGEVAAKNVGGIITISRVTYAFAQSGWERFLWFLALLSINLAFINLLPIPVLDGGHLMFVVIEGIKGSPVNPRVLGYTQILGLVFIVALVVFVTYNDLLRLL